MTNKHRHRPSPSSPELSMSSSAAAVGKPCRSILRETKTEDDDDDDYSDASASQSLYDESQGDEYEPFEKDDDDIESISNAHDDPSSSQKPTKHIPESNNIQGKSSSMSGSNLLNVSYIKIAPLPIFSGTPTECPIAHLSRFNKVCRANGASSIDMRMRIFPVTLEEEAAIWYDLNIEPYRSLSWDEITSSFLEAYRRMEVAEELRSELTRMKQGEGESVRSYFLRLQGILQRGAEHGGLSEALLKGVFIDGLRREFQEWILVQKPDSVNDALRLAFSYEEMRSIRRKKEEVVEDDECCGFCEGRHEERVCEVREAMRTLWRESEEKEKKEFIRSVSMGGRSSEHYEKVEEAKISKGLKMKKKQQHECQCMKHQCSNKQLVSRTTSFPDTTS